MLNVIEYCKKHLFLRHSERCIVGVFVRAVVDNSIHVQVKTIEFWYPILRD